jgi:phosphoglycerate kinase
MQSIKNFDFTNKRALIRVDFNVPLDKETNEVKDDTRIRAALPTINYILKNGGSVVLMSHLGRPKSGPEDVFSLKHLVKHISSLLGKEINFSADCISEESFKMSSNLKNGEVLLLENLRFYKEEEKGDENFAKKLAKHADVYVNDAFGTAHRAHASTAVIAQFFPKDKMFGFLMETEILNVDKVLFSKEKPVTAIVGGAKVSSKITILEHLLDKVDNIIIGGGMAYTFVKALGGKIGNSLVEDDYVSTALKIMEEAIEKKVKIFLPVDTIAADKFDNDAKTIEVDIREIPDNWLGLDTGSETSKICHEILLKSKVILWNGPMGVFEMENFSKGTKDIAKSLVEATKNGAFTLVGGGDSVAAINKFHLADQVSYVSTGGGAMLEYLEGLELPGIKAIRS